MFASTLGYQVQRHKSVNSVEVNSTVIGSVTARPNRYVKVVSWCYSRISKIYVEPGDDVKKGGGAVPG